MLSNEKSIEATIRDKLSSERKQIKTMLIARQ